MLIRPPRGASPTNGDYNDPLGSMLPQSIAHPCLPFAPLVVDELEEWQTGIPGDYYHPPKCVLAGFYAKEWSVTASIEAGVSVAVDAEPLVIPANDVGERSSAYGAGGAVISKLATVDGSFIRFSLVMGFFNFTRCTWTPDSGGLWLPGIEININGIIRDGDGMITASGSAGTNLNGFTGSPVSINFEVAGDVIPIVKSVNEFGSWNPTGTITATVKSWLEPL